MSSMSFQMAPWPPGFSMGCRARGTTQQPSSALSTGTSGCRNSLRMHAAPHEFGKDRLTRQHLCGYMSCRGGKLQGDFVWPVQVLKVTAGLNTDRLECAAVAKDTIEQNDAIGHHAMEMPTIPSAWIKNGGMRETPESLLAAAEPVVLLKERDHACVVALGVGRHDGHRRHKLLAKQLEIHELPRLHACTMLSPGQVKAVHLSELLTFKSCHQQHDCTRCL